MLDSVSSSKNIRIKDRNAWRPASGQRQAYPACIGTRRDDMDCERKAIFWSWRYTLGYLTSSDEQHAQANLKSRPTEVPRAWLCLDVDQIASSVSQPVHRGVG